jgi:hypothetical protein
MANEQEQLVQEIQVSIDEAKKFVTDAEAVKRLFKNRDFKKIFTDGYFKEEPARLVALMTDPEFQSEERQRMLRDDMIGISSLRRYLMNVQRLGYQMEQRIKASEEELQELQEEG